MLNSTNTLSPLNDRQSHPFFTSTNEKDKADQLHRLLLDLAKNTSEKELKSVFRKTADFFREAVFGKTQAQIRTAVLEALKDYFDGEECAPLEINNLEELTGIDEPELLPVLNKMVAAGEILQGRRRRYNEAGAHYNAIYKLKV
jgi:hypothetical protein